MQTVEREYCTRKKKNFTRSQFDKRGHLGGGGGALLPNYICDQAAAECPSQNKHEEKVSSLQYVQVKETKSECGSA